MRDVAAPGAQQVGVIVLCGGTSVRMGGGDKTAAPLGDRTVLDHLVESLPADWQVVCVGEARPLRRDVAWTREDPPHGGPVAGLQAGLASLDGRIDPVVVLAGDQPFSARAAQACAAALTAPAGADAQAVAARQPDGRWQPLLTAYRRGPLTEAVGSAPPGSGVYRALSALHVVTLEGGDSATLDVDTPVDLDRARAVVDADADGRTAGRQSANGGDHPLG